MKRSLLLASCLVLAASTSWGQSVTIRHFSSKSRLVYYTDRAIQRQVARFETPAPGSIERFTVWLGGENATGKATVRLLGTERGAPAPFFGAELIAPLIVQKKKKGIEAVTINLPKPVPIQGAQFFVELSDMSGGTYLMSDRVERKSACTDVNGEYGRQILLKADGSWENGKYGYAIEVEFRPRENNAPGFVDVSREALKMQAGDMSGTASVAWGDVNNDRRLDLLATGRLFLNNGDGTFTDFTREAGLEAGTGADILIDINNDNSPDILSVRETSSRILLNDGAGRFAGRALPIPPIANPASFSVLDYDGDGFSDVFVGRSAGNRGYLLRNTGGTGYTADTAVAPVASGGVQWIWPEHRAQPCLATIDNAAGTCTIWERVDEKEGADGFRSVARHDVGASTGGHWADYNNDGQMDLLLPRIAGTRMEQLAPGAAVSFLSVWNPERGLQGRGAGDVGTMEEMIGYGGGSWADINNDGRLDFLAASRCLCSPVDVFEQQPSGRFERKTFEYGFHGVAAGPDAAWADYDGDGRLDVAMMKEGRLVLYRNQSVGGGRFAEIDLVPAPGMRTVVGARVELYAGGMRQVRTVTAGRGLLIEEPPRLHFGLGDEQRIDSVVLTWPGSDAREVFRGIETNTLTGLVPGETDASSANTIAISATPNPFRDELEITYVLPADGSVTVDIYSVAGRHVTCVAQGEHRSGPHTVRWNARDAKGEVVPQGGYIVRMKNGSREISKPIVLAR